MSTLTSNIEGSGSPTITGLGQCAAASLNATDIKANTKVTTPVSVITSYVKLGNVFLMSGASNAATTIIKTATALVGATVIGSLYVSAAGKVWLFTANDAATRLSSGAN